MSRVSFRQALLVAFLLISLLLAGAAIQGVLTLEQFAERSRAEAQGALRMSSAIQVLDERTVDMERSARQYLLLGEVALLDRFTQASDAALQAVDQLAGIDLPPMASLLRTWRDEVGALRQALAPGGDDAAAVERLRRLRELNEALAQIGRESVDADNAALLAELEANRIALVWQVVIAIGGALLLATLFGWWLLRSLVRLEKAIDGLGESRFDTPIDVPGPADLRRVGRRLDWLRLRLAALEANRTRVLNHVSHELKTPLAALREGIALLSDEVVGRLGREQREVVDILRQNAMSLQERIEDLLRYNAATFDARRLLLRRTSVRALVEEVVASQQLQSQVRDVRVVIEGQAPAPEMDVAKIRIVLGNLLSNAISFSPPGAEVRFVVKELPGAVRIDCVDQGPGVAPEDVERIFEPFYQGSRQPAEARRGSGLGLSIVREFVVAHGGSVEVLQSDRGAHFRVELPNET